MMAKNDSYRELTTDQLRAKLQSIQRVHTTVVGIFVVIILAWLVLGYWKTNVPVFISTVAMSIAISGALLASRFGLHAELEQRERQAKGEAKGVEP